MTAGSGSRQDLFASVESSSFAEMIGVERYQTRTSAFDSIIAETHRHFWDPLDPDYIDLATSFDIDELTVLPADVVPELQSAVKDRLTPRQCHELANASARWWLSSVLHGEQGALSLSAHLCQLLSNPGAVEYAANQAREEARHVTAFSRYIAARWGAPLPASSVFGGLLADLVSTPDVGRKIVGMQILVEGLAMGIFAALHSRSTDPALTRLTQLVMVDEAFHHKAGKMWADETLPQSTDEQRTSLEDWVGQVFQVLMFNMFHPQHKQGIYQVFGLDWQWVRDAMRESYSSDVRREQLTASNGIFRPLIRTLFKSGLITERTRALYSPWVRLSELSSESDNIFGNAVVRDGLGFLEQVNTSRQSRWKVVSQARADGAELAGTVTVPP
jgi:hypothetical protein